MEQATRTEKKKLVDSSQPGLPSDGTVAVININDFRTEIHTDRRIARVCAYIRYALTTWMAGQMKPLAALSIQRRLSANVMRSRSTYCETRPELDVASQSACGKGLNEESHQTRSSAVSFQLHAAENDRFNGSLQKLKRKSSLKNTSFNFQALCD